MKIRVPKGCQGIDVGRGTPGMGPSVRYDSNSRGVVEIENPKHERAYRNSGNAPYLHDASNMSLSNLSLLERQCSRSGCRFVGFPWQEICPRDGAPMGEPRIGEQL